MVDEKVTKNSLVMVVEDEELLRQAIVKKIEMKGLRIVPCSSAEQALGYLRANPDDLPDVVWLDYKLTGINGLEFMQELKQNDRWEGIPVVVVSNSASTEKIDNMMALGVEAYYQKASQELEKLVEMVSGFAEKNKK